MSVSPCVVRICFPFVPRITPAPFLSLFFYISIIQDYRGCGRPCVPHLAFFFPNCPSCPFELRVLFLFCVADFFPVSNPKSLFAILHLSPVDIVFLFSWSCSGGLRVNGLFLGADLSSDKRFTLFSFVL